MAKLERLYTIPLGDAFKVSRDKRTPRAVKLIRAFITRHMKARDERVVISEALNKLLWERSIQKPPRRVKVRLIKEDGETVRAYLPDEKIPEPKKAADSREEKKEEKKEAPKNEKPSPAASKPAPAPPAATSKPEAPKPAAAKAPEPAKAPAQAQKSDRK